jgi:hypothetical protein
MSLYRQPGRVRPLMIAAVAVVALLIGLGIGYALGHSARSKPSAQDAVAQLRNTLRPLGAGLELIPTEYPKLLHGTSADRAAVHDDVQRIRAALTRAAPDLRVLDPAGARTLSARVAALEAAVRAQTPPARVTQCAAAAQSALAAVPGGH